LNTGSPVTGLTKSTLMPSCGSPFSLRRDAAEVEQRRRGVADAALVIDEGRLEAAVAVELARIAFAEGHRLDVGVALRARHVVIDPGGVEELHQRPVERVDPDYRLVGIVAVVVPGAVRREDQIAAIGGTALAFDDGVAALVGEDGAARVRGMQVHGRDVAGIVDRDRAADGVGDLQPAVQARIEEQDALAVGELDRRHVRLAGDLGNLMEIRAVFLPAPHMRRGLHLRDGDAAAGELSASGAVGLAEPGTLGRRICLGAYPDVVLARFGVDRLHELAGFVGKPAGSGRLHRYGGHGVFSCKS
jgi:hypothetical protein